MCGCLGRKPVVSKHSQAEGHLELSRPVGITVQQIKHRFQSWLKVLVCLHHLLCLLLRSATINSAKRIGISALVPNLSEHPASSVELQCAAHTCQKTSIQPAIAFSNPCDSLPCTAALGRACPRMRAVRALFSRVDNRDGKETRLFPSQNAQLPIPHSVRRSYYEGQRRNRPAQTHTL